RLCRPNEESSGSREFERVVDTRLNVEDRGETVEGPVVRHDSPQEESVMSRPLTLQQRPPRRPPRGLGGVRRFSTCSRMPLSLIAPIDPRVYRTVESRGDEEK